MNSGLGYIIAGILGAFLARCIIRADLTIPVFILLVAGIIIAIVIAELGRRKK